MNFRIDQNKKIIIIKEQEAHIQEKNKIQLTKTSKSTNRSGSSIFSNKVKNKMGHSKVWSLSIKPKKKKPTTINKLNNRDK